MAISHALRWPWQSLEMALMLYWLQLSGEVKKANGEVPPWCRPGAALVQHVVPLGTPIHATLHIACQHGACTGKASEAPHIWQISREIGSRQACQ